MKLSVPPIPVGGATSSPPLQNIGGGFLQQLEQISQKLQGFDGQMLKGKGVPIEELIAFQIKAQRYAISVELCAKTAEGIANTVRRFHSNQ